MKLIGKISALAISLLLVNRTISAVLSINLRNGVYPTDADSIGIPLMETARTSMIGAILLLSLVTISFIAHSVRTHPNRRPLFLILAVILAISYVLAMAFFALWGLYWFAPNHYFIVAACSIAVLIVIWLAASDYASLRPNNSFKPT